MNQLPLIYLLILVMLLPATATGTEQLQGYDDSMEAPRFAPRQAVHTAQQGNLLLSSVLKPHGAPYPNTQFTVLREEPGAFGKARYTVMAVAGPHAHADFDLNPGRYVVQARNDAVTVEQVVEVPPSGMHQLPIVLDAGELHLGSLMDSSGQPADETWFRVLREDTDSYGRPVRIQVAGNGYGQTASFLLPAGDYIAEASFGDTHVEAPVHIGAGDVVSRELVLNAGRLALFGTLSQGGEPLSDVTFSVLRRSGADPDGWSELTRAEHAGAITFVLPQGEYRVRAQLDRAVAELPITLGAGETQHHELPLNAGELLVYATLAGQSDPLLDAWFRLQAEPGHSIPVVPGDGLGGPGHSMRYVVPAGRYRATAGLGESQGDAIVDVEAGQSQTLAIDLDAARVTMRLVPGTGRDAYAYTWFSVYRIEQDAQGKEWRRRVFNEGFYPQTDVVLPAGRYVAFARSDEQRGETLFTVAPGESRLVTIVAGH